jgi:hypothetical protein
VIHSPRRLVTTFCSSHIMTSYCVSILNRQRQNLIYIYLLIKLFIKITWHVHHLYNPALSHHLSDENADGTGSVYQWRNVISGGPRFKIFEGPLVEVLKARSTLLKCHFLDFGERFYRILMVRKRHCNISEALANVFALSPKPGGPHLAHWGWGPPGSPGLSPW